MSRLKLFIPVIIVVLLGIGFALSIGRNTGVLPSVLINKPIPEFALPSLLDLNETITAEDLKGKFALLNVWATWCPPCRAEHPYLVELSKSGIPIYGLNWNDRKRDLALTWIDQLGNPFELIIYDAENRLGIDLGVYAAPETFVVDPAGIIVHKYIGELTPSVWQKEFAPFFNENNQQTQVRSSEQ